MYLLYTTSNDENITIKKIECKKAGHCVENSKTITSDEKETNKPNALENK